jgi:hypothetical protein
LNVGGILRSPEGAVLYVFLQFGYHWGLVIYDFGNYFLYGSGSLFGRSLCFLSVVTGFGSLNLSGRGLIPSLVHL